MWEGVTSPVVISNTVLQVLLLSGDVETNSGPIGPEDGERYEQCLVEGLAKLCRAAPTDTVRNVLRVWSPNKPGNEIRSTWQQGRRFLAPDLKGTLAWLTQARESDIKGTKYDVAEKLLIALEALLPDTCQLCKEIFCVEREDNPSLRCKGCSQGFHQACYDRLEIGPSLAELPGEFSWLCTVCAPLYQLKTVIGGNRGQERPRLSRRDPSVPQPVLNQTPAQGVGGVSSGGADGGGAGGEGGGGGVEADTGEAHPASSDTAATAEQVPASNLTAPPEPPPLPPNVPLISPGRDINSDNTVPGPVNSGQDCALYLSGECPFGISGKTGGICCDNHPKRCMPYMRWGNKSDKGCSGITCGKSHPTLCPKSLDLRCLDGQCPWKLHTHRCTRADTGVRRGDYGRSEGARWGDRGDRDQRVSDRRPARGYNDGPRNYGGTWAPQGGARLPQGGAGPPQGGAGPRQWGAGVPQSAGNQPQPAPWNSPGFQGMTAQQTLLGALEQQLQQALTRAIIQALAGVVPGLAGGGSVPPSS